MYGSRTGPDPVRDARISSLEDEQAEKREQLRKEDKEAEMELTPEPDFPGDSRSSDA